MSLGLNIGLRALLTSQSGLDVVGQNITNANTPGYSRQEVGLVTAPSLRTGSGLVMGTGVSADSIRRTVDDLLNARMLPQMGSIGRLDARLYGMEQVDLFLGEGSANGVGASLENFFARLSALSISPDDAVLRSDAVSAAGSFATGLNEVDANLKGMEQDLVSRLETQVRQVNALAQRISSLNDNIRKSEVVPGEANDLRDSRDQAARDLAELIDVQVSFDGAGSMRVIASGGLLVHPGGFAELEVGRVNDQVQVSIDGGVGALRVRGGSVGGTLDLLQNFIPQFQDDIDGLAHRFALEVNRAHSTGIPQDGPFHALKAANAIVDRDQDGLLGDELLSNSGLPFEIQDGELFVNVTNEATGGLTRHRIGIDASHTTAGQFVSELNAIQNIAATLDADGRVTILADVGFGFDFSARLNPNPDGVGSLGGGRASLGTATTAPFALTTGDTLQLQGLAGPFTVTIQPGALAVDGAATAEEVAAALNADPNLAAGGLTASAVGDALVLQTSGAGAAESFQVLGGSALGALGWTAGTTVTGSDTSTDIAITGSYAGSENDQLTIRPNQDGVVGTTPGLKLDVFDSSGARVAQVDVGAGYVPGQGVEILDGIQIEVGFGQLSATDNDVMVLDVTADSDTSDVLPALGLNSFYGGSTAADLSVRADIVKDPSLLAASSTGAPGDGGVLAQLLEVQQASIDEFNGVSLAERLGEITIGVGLEISNATDAVEAEQFLLDGLEARRDAVSGVNVDEELVRMIEFEQAYNAASQYIRVVSELSEQLMTLV